MLTGQGSYTERWLVLGPGQRYAADISGALIFTVALTGMGGKKCHLGRASVKQEKGWRGEYSHREHTVG